MKGHTRGFLEKLEPEALQGTGESYAQMATISIAISLKRLTDFIIECKRTHDEKYGQ